MNAKMSKSKKKKLKKRAKRNQALMEETMQHIEEVEREEQMQETDTKATVNGGAGVVGSSPASSGPDREAAPTSNNSTTKLAGMSNVYCLFVLFSTWSFYELYLHSLVIHNDFLEASTYFSWKK